MTTLTPGQALQALLEGNGRFVRDEMLHPSQDARRRAEISLAQDPFAVLFGCSDSRVAAEIIFDQGLGDLFVVRTAGHVLDTTVVGSIEYGVEMLGTPLIVVLGHDYCGAVAAATDALNGGELPPGFVRTVVDRVIPSIIGLAEGTAPADRVREHSIDPVELGREHVRQTVRMLHGYSISLATAVAEGRCAIVGAEYALTDGALRLVEVVGDVSA